MDQQMLFWHAAGVFDSHHKHHHHAHAKGPTLAEICSHASNHADLPYILVPVVVVVFCLVMWWISAKKV